MSDEFVGSSLYCEFAGSELSSRFHSFDENEEVGLVEKSAGDDTYRAYLATLTDGGISMEFLHEADGTVIWAAIAPGTEGTLIWGPEGTASAKEKRTVDAVVKSRRRAIVYDDVVKINIDFAFQTAVVDSVY